MVTLNNHIATDYDMMFNILHKDYCTASRYPCQCIEKLDWLSVEAEQNPGLCDSTECYVTHFFNPSYFNDFCANFIEYPVSIDSTIVDDPSMVGLDTFNISSLDRCISIGEKYEISLKFVLIQLLRTIVNK